MKFLVRPIVASIFLTCGPVIQPTSVANDDSSAWRGQTLAEFRGGDDNAANWQIVNDGVMGGLSKGNFAISEAGILTFSGTLSLKNNGGFSSLRSAAIDRNLSDEIGILLRIRGDGRTYNMRLESDATFRGMPVSFSGEFETKAGQWEQIKIPFSKFRGSWRGISLPKEKLNPAVIRELGLLIADKKSGPFKLEIEYIRTYGPGQGDFTQREAKAQDETNLAKSKQPTKVLKKVIDAVAGDDRFSTLNAALDAAKLTNFFQWDNKKTVFAPTNEAFAKLPEEAIEDLLKPENKDRLVQILSYHVHPGSLDLPSALSLAIVDTVEKRPLKVSFEKGRVKVNNAIITEADIKCSDGIVHVIDTVLLPEPKEKNLLTTAQANGNFSTLLAAAEAAGLVPALTGKDELTVFAPTDEAFTALPDGTVENLFKQENKKQLIELLTTHIVSGKVSAGDALNAGKAKSLSGSQLSFMIDNGLFTVNGSAIRSVGIDGGNGVIHVIDSVIGFAGSASECGLSPESTTEKNATSPKTTSKKTDNAAELIMAAIDKGVPLYNNGKVSECADIYEKTLNSLSEMKQFDAKTRDALSEVTKTGKHYDEDRRAWFYRHALDRTIEMMVRSRG